MRERANEGCESCLSTTLWEIRGCPIRESKKKMHYARVQPYVADVDRCPVHGAELAQSIYSELVLALEINALPYEGGYMNQPHAFIEAMKLVKSLRNAAHNEKLDRKRKKK